MKRSYQYKQILIFSLGFLIIFSISSLISETVRIQVASLLSPFWRATHFLENHSHESQQLEAENYLLRQEIVRLTKKKAMPPLACAVSASVLYRDPTTWNSTLWVDVGESTNEELGERIVAKNSCVLVGRALVGMVDYVGKKQSRVRLLTDRRFHPSVRSVRGEMQNQAILEHLDVILPALSQNKEYAALFQRIKERLGEEKESYYLAKGYLEGAGVPLWRRRGNQLVGIGFNYDFADAQGEAKRINLEQPSALLKEGDLLVTTGMDGLCPADLFVAFVTKVYPLREGDVSYKIEAKPYVADLGRLTSCTIIAPLEFIPESQILGTSR